MLKVFKHLVFTFAITISLVSCNDGVSLQQYFVDNQESGSFITQDVPLSLLKIDDSKLSEEQKDAYNSVKRLNFLGYKADEANFEQYTTELSKVKTILSNKKYNDLIEFSDKGSRVVVKYIGEETYADEVVVFGSSKEYGFAIVRVLGDDMSPDKMVTLVGALQNAHMDNSQIEDIMNFFK